MACVPVLVRGYLVLQLNCWCGLLSACLLAAEDMLEEKLPQLLDSFRFE